MLTCFGWRPWPPTPSRSCSGGIQTIPAGMLAALLSRALCQGAALHYVNGHNGVKDFDVWSFYAQYDDWPFPARWRGTRDFGPSKFGRYSCDPPRYTGRRVDLLGRSLRVELGADPAEVIRRYLPLTSRDVAEVVGLSRSGLPGLAVAWLERGTSDSDSVIRHARHVPR